MLDSIEDPNKSNFSSTLPKRLQSAQPKARNLKMRFAVDRNNISPERAQQMIKDNGEWNVHATLNTELPTEYKRELQKLLRVRRS
jgi:hypothetical protein